MLATALAVLAARGERHGREHDAADDNARFPRHRRCSGCFIDETSVAAARSDDRRQSGGACSRAASWPRRSLPARQTTWSGTTSVGNYLKGETPPPFDLLYWNGDGTNLPGPMYCWYLRNTYLENKLREPGKLTVLRRAGRPGRDRRAGVPVRARARTTSCPGRAPIGAPSCCGGKRTLRAGRQRPHRRRDQPAGEEEAQLLDRQDASCRRRRCGSTHARSEHRGAGGRCGPAGSSSMPASMVPAPKSAGNRKFPVIEPAPGTLRQGKGRVSPEQSVLRIQRRTSWTDIVIVAATRTAVGKFGGTLAKTPAPELGRGGHRQPARARQAHRRPDRRGHPRPGAHRRLRPEPGAPDRHQERPAAERAGADHQRRLRLRPEGGDARRPGDRATATPRSSSPAARRT